MAESKEELQSLFMKVKEESEKVGLKLRRTKEQNPSQLLSLGEINTRKKMYS